MAENVYFVAGDGTDAAYPEATPHAVMTDGDDTLTAKRTDDIISTGYGADVVDGGKGDDVIGGLIHRDPISGAPVGIAYGAIVVDTDGDTGDAVAVTGGDLLSGGKGDDLIFVEYDSVADGGSGRDTAVVSLYDMWIPWVASTILNTFNDLALDVDLRDAATGSLTLQVGGLGGLGVTLTSVEQYQIAFGDGSDRAFAGDYDDVLWGGHGLGEDELHGRGGADRLLGELGGDSLYGDEGADILEGGTPGFTFFEDFASDQLDGGANADLMTGGRGDAFLGGTGSDTAHIALETSAFSYTLDLDAMVSGALYNLGDGAADPDYLHDGTQTQDLERIASLALGDGSDVVGGSVRAFQGGDTAFTFMRRGIEMGGGDDQLTLRGTLTDDFTSLVYGGSGTDLLRLGGDYAGLSLGFGSVQGFEAIAVRRGHDYVFTAGFLFDATTIDASDLRAGDALTFNLLANAAPMLQVLGGRGADRVTVSQAMFDAQQRFDLGAGDDTVAIASPLGSTLLLAATSFSSVETVAFVHGVGNEHFVLTTNDANLGAGRTMTIDGSALGEGILGIDTLSFDGSAETNGAFVILGGAGGDVLGAGALADHVEGGNGDDILLGYNGADTLIGGRGGDRLVGGYGQDVMTGGANGDRFVFADATETGATQATADRITDFATGADRIDVRAIDADADTAGNQNFAFVGAAVFTGVAGQLRYSAVAGGLLIEGDTTGDGVADFAIKLDGATTLAAGDFVL